MIWFVGLKDVRFLDVLIPDKENFKYDIDAEIVVSKKERFQISRKHI